MAFDAGTIRSSLELDINPFQRALDQARADALRFAADDFRAKAGVDSAEAQRAIDEVRAALDQLSRDRADPSVHLSDEEALAKLAELKAKLEEPKHVDIDTEEGKKHLDELKSKLDESAKGVSGLIAGGLALSPALIPGIAAVTAGLGAAVVPLTAATVGFGALGVFALPAIKEIGTNLQKTQPFLQAFEAAQPGPAQGLAWAGLQAQIAKLPPELRPVAQGIIDVKLEIFKLGKEVHPQLFGAFNTWLSVAHTLLPQIVTPAQQAALALDDLGKSVQKGLGGPTWTIFIDRIVPEIRPAITAIGRSFGFLLETVGNLAVAFAPFAAGFEGGMVRMTKALADWSAHLAGSAGLQTFMQYVKDNGPAFWSALKNIGDALVNIAKASAGLGGVEIRALDEFAKAINAIASIPGFGPVIVDVGLLALAIGKLGGAGLIAAGVSNLAGALKVLIFSTGLAEGATLIERFGGSLKVLAGGEIAAAGANVARVGGAAAGAAPGLAGAAGGIGAIATSAGAMIPVLAGAGVVVGGVLLGLELTKSKSDDVVRSVQDQKNKWGDLNTQLLTTRPAVDENSRAIQRAADAHKAYSDSAQTAIQATRQQSDAYHQNALNAAQMAVDANHAFQIMGAEARTGGKETKEGLVAELGIGRADVDRILNEYNITAASDFGRMQIIGAGGGAKTVEALAKELNLGVPQVQAIADQYGAKLATEGQVMAIKMKSAAHETVAQMSQELGLGRDQVETIGRQYNIRMAGTTAEMVLIANRGGADTVEKLQQQLGFGIADIENIGRQYGIKLSDQMALDKVITSVGGADTVQALADKLGVGIGQVGAIVAVYGKLIAQGINPVLEGIGAKDINVQSTPSGGFSPGNAQHGFAAGGIVTQPGLFMAGEQAPAHQEAVISFNPAYHAANVGYWAESGKRLGIPGFATGGFTDPSQVPAPPSFAAFGTIPVSFGATSDKAAGFEHDKVVAFVAAQAAARAAVSSSGGGPFAGGPIRDYMLAEVAKRWPGAAQAAAFDFIESHEAGYDPNAANPSSNARGLAQNIAGWGPDYQPGNVQQQTAWMLNYIGCVPVDALILTKEGWKSRDQVQVGDETIGYDPGTGTSKWTKVTAVHKYDAAPVVRMSNSRWSTRCTPNHRWVTEKAIQSGTNGGPVTSRREEMVRADRLGTRHRVRMAAPLVDGEGLPINDNEAELLGWILGDGCVQRHRRPNGRPNRARPHGKPGWSNSLNVSVYQSKERWVARLRELLEQIPHSEYRRAGNHWTTNEGWTFRLPSPYANDLLQRSGYESDLELMVLRMSASQRKAFLVGLMGADGYEREGQSAVLAQNAGPSLDAAALAIYLEGYYGHQTDSAGQKHVSLTKPWLKAGTFKVEDLEPEPVWCVTTELGSWTMLQEGQIMLTGNSRYGDPISAAAFWRAHNWYGDGGIFTKPAIIGVGEKGPEAVVPLGHGGAFGGGDIRVTIDASVNIAGDATPQTVAAHQATQSGTIAAVLDGLRSELGARNIRPPRMPGLG